jgi:hypothetical protein
MVHGSWFVIHACMTILQKWNASKGKGVVMSTAFLYNGYANGIGL